MDQNMTMVCDLQLTFTILCEFKFRHIIASVCPLICLKFTELLWPRVTWKVYSKIT